MNRQLGLPLAAGLLSSLLFLSLAKGIAFGAMLSYLAPMPLMMAGLGLGMTAAVIAGSMGLATVALVADGVSTLPYLAMAVLPTLVVTHRALLWRTAADGSTEWYPPGLILAWLTAAGLAMVLIAALLLAGTPQGIKGWVADIMANTLDLVAADLPQGSKDRAVAWWAPLFPAMVAGSWLMMAVLNASGAQGLMTRLGQAKRPRPAYGQLWLPEWLGLGLIGMVLVALVGQDDVRYVSVNLAVILGLPFACLGLAGIHQRAKGRKNAGVILALTYGLLILASGWALPVLAGVGLVRFWTKRFRRPTSGGGMEG